MPLRKPKYKDKWHTGTPGARWAVMTKFIIARTPGDPYLTRWRILHTPWFGILLHKIDGPDPDQDVHDHPWEFVSVVLKGGYTEKVVRKTGAPILPLRVTTYHTHKRGSVHRMRRGVYHKIATLHGAPTWTLVLTGPRRGEWGFLTPNGHVNWKEYLGV